MRLVIAVVAAPVADKLAHQVGLLVAVLGRTHPVNRIGAAGFAQVLQLGRDLIQGLIPADALVLAVDQLHRIAQAKLAMAVLANGCTFGAVRTQVDRRVKHRFLTDPHAIFNHRIDGASHRTMGAHGALDFDLATAVGHGCIARTRLFHQRELGGGQTNTHAQTGTAQKATAIHRGQSLRQAALQAIHKGRGSSRRNVGFTGQQHGNTPVTPGSGAREQQLKQAAQLKRGWSGSSVSHGR